MSEPVASDQPISMQKPIESLTDLPAVHTPEPQGPVAEQPTMTFPALDAEVSALPVQTDPVPMHAAPEQALDAVAMHAADPVPLYPADPMTTTQSGTVWHSSAAAPTTTMAPPVAQVYSAPPVREGLAGVTCPECGSTQEVVLNRRESVDFCRSCDYPLFWTPSLVLRDFGAGSDESLRRLPGTVGRATLASLPCPHCAEPNAVRATTCVRCGRPLHLEAPPPPVVQAPRPLPPIEEPEERGVPWWAWVAVFLSLAAIATVAILAATHHL